MKTQLSTWAVTALLLLFSNVYLISQPTWDYFTSNGRLTSLAARGNDILSCSDDCYGFYHLDTLGNATHHTIQNGGVPFATIDRVAIDADGGWWVAHQDGVARYDGATWTTWSFVDMGLASGQTINGIETVNDGRFFVCINNTGVSVYENGVWSTISTGNSGLPSNTVRDITADSNGNTYFATSAGLAVWDGNLWTVHTTASTGITLFNNCTGVALEGSGILWATSSLNRLVKYENGVWTSYNAAALGFPSSIGLTSDVLFDPQGRLWLAYSKGVAVRQDTTWTYTSDTLLGCLGSPSPFLLYNRLAVDGSGRVWSSLCGLHKFDSQTEPEPVPHTNITLSSGQVFAITQDSSGVMWFAGNGGISSKDGNTWNYYDPADLGLANNTAYTAHGDANGNVWFGIDVGAIIRYDGANWTVFDTIATLLPGFGSYWSIASAPDGTVWFSIVPAAAFSGRLARYENGNWTFFDPTNAPLPNNYDITAIVVDDDGTAWFLANDRLLRYDGVNWTSFDPMDAGLNYNVLRRMVRGTDGALWITSDEGLLRFDGAAWTSLTNTNSNIPHNNIYTVDFDVLGGMYVGFDPPTTEPNLGVLNNGVWTALVPTGFEPGFSTRPWDFFTDRYNRLWYPNWQDDGVYRYDPKLVNIPAIVQSEATGLWVFPNPATDVVTVVWTGLSGENVRVRLIDPTGKVVLENTIIQGSQQMTIQLPVALPPGIYVAEVTDGFGRREVARFVRM